MCSGYVESGRGVCAGFRIATGFLDDAVIDGIQKRLDMVLNPGELRQRLTNLLAREAEPVDAAPQLTARLADTRRRIERLVGVLASGSEPMPSVRAALVGLERDRERLERELVAVQTREVTGAGIEAVADELVTALTKVRDVLKEGEPEERKAVVRSFLRGITIDRNKNRATLSGSAFRSCQM